MKLLLFKDCRKLESYKEEINKICSFMKNIKSQSEVNKILDIYKSYMLYISNVQNRRWKQYPVFITLLTGIFTISEKLFFSEIMIQLILSVCAIVISIFWTFIVLSSKIEMNVKFDILRCLEESLPVRIFEYEQILYDQSGRVSNVALEKILSIIFSIFSIVYFLYKFFKIIC